MTSDELEGLADEQYKKRYKVIRRRFHEGNAAASQVELATLTVLAGIQKTLLEIQSALENFNFEQVGEYKHASTKPIEPTPTRYIDGDPVFATSDEAFDYMAYNNKPAYSEDSLKFDNDNRRKGLDD